MREEVEQPPDAALSVALVGIPDLQLDLAARRPEPVLRHRDLCTLPDHIPSDADPGPALQVEPHPRGLGKRAPQGRREIDRLERHEPRTDLPGAGRQPPEQRLSVARHLFGQVGHQHLDRASPEQRAGEPEPLGRIGRPEHQQPGQIHAAGHRLERVEGAGEAQPGGDRPPCLRLGDEPQGERGLAARQIAAERHLGFADEPTGTQDRIEGGEPGGDDAVVERREGVQQGRGRQRQRREGALDGKGRSAIAEPNRRTPPPRLETRECCRKRLDRPGWPTDGRIGGRDRAVHRPTHDRTSVLFVKHARRARTARAAETGARRATSDGCRRQL